MAYLFTNFARSLLDGAIGAGDTSITVTTGDGALFPAPTGGDIFAAVLFNKTSGLTEIVECTARSGDVLTVTRAREGTSAISFLAGDVIELRPTKGFFDTRGTVQKIQDGTLKSGIAGGTANAQTLTLSPAITAYNGGLELFFVPVGDNTAAATLAVNGLAATSIKKFVDNVAVALDPGDLDVDAYAHVVYVVAAPDFFQLLNPRLGSAALLADGPGDGQLPTGLDLKDTARTFTKQQAAASASLVLAAGASTWDLNDAPVADVTLDQDLTALTINNPLAGATYLLKITQDNVGGWLITWPVSVLWPFGVVPTLTSAADAVDLVSLFYDGVNFHGTHVADFQ